MLLYNIALWLLMSLTLSYETTEAVNIIMYLLGPPGHQTLDNFLRNILQNFLTAMSQISKLQ